MALHYAVQGIALDNFRYALMKKALAGIGFTTENKNLYLVRPSDIMKVQPVIESCFNNQRFTWGDCPPLRWANGRERHGSQVLPDRLLSRRHGL
ncbi:hypothetical protein KL86CLO1_11679 [uncultured Eubacteriales bacterium]|uniref:Uncharacterized protein n=1 Tax=uncultured Eubacteriales bacterium TaxID=172733 RepID=A0A212JTA8_9FIRM|nr:hypothetical protein KL86CLO1_11679 [uncultured Eubacteriales bacterium]